MTDNINLNEKLFNTLFSSKDFGILLINPQGRLYECNDTALAMMGYTKEEYFDLSNSEVTYPDDVQLTEDFFNDLLKGKTDNQRIEKRYIRKDGTCFWAELSVTPVHNEAENVIAFSCIIFDITKRKQADKELRESQQKLDLFFSQSLVGFSFTTLDEPVEWNETTDKDRALDYIFSHLRTTKINDAMLAQYKASREQFIGLTPNEIYVHNINYGKKLWRKFLDAGSIHYQTDERKFDGTKMTIEGDYQCIYDTMHRITGSFGIQRDVTESKKNDDQMRLFSHTVRSLSECVSITDTEDRMIFVNEKFLQTYGYTEEELLGNNISMVRSPNNDPKYVKNILPGTKAGSWHGELINRRKDGTDFPISISSTSVQNEKGETVALVGVATDITEKKLAEQKNKQQIRELTAIYKANQLLQKISTPEALASGLHNVLKNTLDYTHGTVLLIDDKSGRMIPFALSDHIMKPEDIKKENKIIQSFDLKVGLGITGLVAQTGKSICTGDVRKHYGYISVRQDILSELCVPLIIDERTIGVVNVESDRLNTFTINDQRVLEVVAAQISVAIQNAQLLEQLLKELSERKQAEKALKGSEKQYSTLVQTMPDGVYRSIPEGKFIDVNPAMCKILGYDTKEELLAIDIKTQLYFDVSDRESSMLQEEHKEMAVFPLKKKDGSKIWVEDHVLLRPS